MRKLFKRLKKWFKRIIAKIKYRFNPDSVSKKERKRIRKEKEMAEQYSHWGNFLRWLYGCNRKNLQVA